MPQGRHVKVLGRGDASLLGSAKSVEAMLRELVDLLGMRLLGAPHLYEVETEIAKLGVEPFEDEGGVTGICVLSTSHCSIHTWPLRPFFVMDVYSCRDFDPALRRATPRQEPRGLRRPGHRRVVRARVPVRARRAVRRAAHRSSTGAKGFSAGLPSARGDRAAASGASRGEPGAPLVDVDSSAPNSNQGPERRFTHRPGPSAGMWGPLCFSPVRIPLDTDGAGRMHRT